jgi:LPXTG-motif cell wall-anchored protein
VGPEAAGAFPPAGDPTDGGGGSSPWPLAILGLLGLGGLGGGAFLTARRRRRLRGGGS